MTIFTDYFKTHWDVILGIIIAYFSLVIPILKYLQDKRKEDKNKRFENYHKLLDDLLGGGPQNIIPMADRQIAILFELRNFPEYYPVTLRIITHLRTIWLSPILVNEMNLTEQYIGLSKWGKWRFDL